MLYALYNKLRRLIAGHGLSQFRILRNLDYRIKSLITKPQKFIEVRGYKYFQDPRSSILASDFDNVEIKLVADLLREGDVFVDVGASIGLFTVIASSKVGASGKVYAFEPDEQSYGVLLKNIEANGCVNVTTEHMAVSDSAGEAMFYTVGDVWQGSSLIDPMSDPDFFINQVLSDYENKNVRAARVKKTTLDEYLGDRRVDYVKTDTEGNEALVLKGMKNVIKHNPEVIIYMEFSPVLLKKFGTNPDQMIRDIQNQGFHVFMTDGEKIEPVKDANFSGNIIFTKRDISRQIEGLCSG